MLNQFTEDEIQEGETGKGSSSIQKRACLIYDFIKMRNFRLQKHTLTCKKK